MLKPFRYAKEALERVSGCRIYRNSLPHGADLFFDIDRRFGLENFHVVFDIGANIGQSAIAYSQYFRNAQIYSFEPVPDTYRQLQNVAQGLSRVHPFNLGMGREPREATIVLHHDNRMSTLLADRPENRILNGQSTSITLDTVAGFSKREGLKVIDFLKVDTEGYDLEVLRGADRLLKDQAILLVLTECEPVPRTGNFVALPETAAFMRGNGYELLGLYEQATGWDGKHVLDYCNALFVAGRILDTDRTSFATRRLSSG